MSGSATGSGMDFQAEAFAYVACHGLADQTFDWFDDFPLLPSSIRLESSGPGDDLRVADLEGNVVEIQAKSGLTKRAEFWDAIVSLLSGLQESCELRGVLLLDRRASQTLRDDLRVDILRLADQQMDELKSITTEVLTRVKHLGIDQRSFRVFRRLRIVVANFEPAADGRSAARALLSHVVADPSDCETAWKMLVDQGHDLIARKGQKNVQALARILSTTITLKSDSERAAIVAEEFRARTARANATFVVPGLDIRLSTLEDSIDFELSPLDEHAYTHEQTFVEQVEEYRKGVSKRRKDCCTAEWIVEFDRSPVVVIGGPGAGKSTFARRLACAYSKRGVLCTRVGLASVSRLVMAGNSFHDALANEMANTTGTPLVHTRAIASKLRVLLADGLDETDPERRHVADAIIAWANAHPDCSVVVTTRPVGHSKTLLPKFRHYRIPNLESHEVRDHAARLHEVAINDHSRQAELLQRFNAATESGPLRLKKYREESRGIRELAARNPLMLGFLVRLNLDDEPLSGHAARLYQHIISSAETSDVVDRRGAHRIPSNTAHTILDRIGWYSCQERGISYAQLVDRVATDVSSKNAESPCAAAELVERVIAFWEERRIVERLTAGKHAAIEFLHPSIGEFAAARYLSCQSAQDLLGHLRLAAPRASMRRVIELVCGLPRGRCVVECLLDLDDTEDVCCNAAAVAAAGLLEFETQDVALVESTASCLIPRLDSPVPLVGIEAAVALAPLACHIPDVVRTRVANLQSHEQPWTALAALALLVATRVEETAVPAFRMWMKRFANTRVSSLSFSGRQTDVCELPYETHDLQGVTAHEGMRLFVQSASETELEEFMRQSSFEHFSLGMLSAFQQVLQEAGYDELAATLHPKKAPDYAKWLDQIAGGTRRARRGDAVFLESLCAIGTPNDDSEVAPPLRSLSAIYEGLGLWQLTRYPTIDLAEGGDEVVRVLLTGIALVMGLDLDELATEARLARRLLETEDRKLWDLLEMVTVEMDWTRVPESTFTTPVLLCGVVHPWSPIRFVAANLLLEVVPKDQAARIVTVAMEVDDDEVLHLIGQLVRPICAEDSATLLAMRLSRKLTRGCEHLFESLLEDMEADQVEEFFPLIFRGLWDDDPVIAAGFAAPLPRLASAFGGQVNRIRTLIDHWGQRGSWCEKHSVRVMGSSCPECHTVVPNPRPALIRVLSEINALRHDELIELTLDEHQAVAKEASETLAAKAKDDARLFELVVAEVIRGRAPAKLAETCLETATEEALESGISTLLECEDARFRLLAAQFLERLTTDEASPIANTLLGDETPAVRTQAVRLLRSLGSGV